MALCMISLHCDNTFGNPVIIISEVIDISCNGRRNVLLNNYVIDKFVDTINGFVCIRMADGHSLYDRVPQFLTVFFVFSQIWNEKNLHVAVFVKIPF